MNININEDYKSKLFFNKAEINNAPLSFFFNVKEPETQQKELVPINTFNGNIYNNINGFIYNSPYLPLNYYNYNINILTPKNNIKIIEKKIPIFQVNYKNMRLTDKITHSGNCKDNIRQIIITHFTNFFLKFVNYIVNKKIDKNTEYHIGYKIKYKIKFVDIIGFDVEKFLSSFATLKFKNKTRKKNLLKIKNIDIDKVKNEILSSFSLLFKKRVFDIFKDIYAKDIKNENDQEIDLSNFGLDDQILILNKEIPAYKKLKEKYKNEEIKTNIMDQIVNSLKNFKKNIFIIKK